MALEKNAATNGGTTTNAGGKSTGQNTEVPLQIWAALQMTGPILRGVLKTGFVLALFVYTRVASAQTMPLRTSAAQAPPTATDAPAQTASALLISEKISETPPKMSYVGEQLSIDAVNATLADVLTQVAALTGVKIDVPASANSERMPVVKLGPGSARQVLASLLRDSHFYYLIQASDVDPEKIQSVLIMPAEKKGNKTEGTDAVLLPSRDISARTAELSVKSETAPTPESPVPAQRENAAAEESSSNLQPASMQPDQVTTGLSAQTDRSMSKPATLSPPQIMSPQNINQQLQQMYQQRMQMIQQNRQATVPAAGPGSE